MPSPRLRMFAGPNGSGKSVLIQELKDSGIPIGPVINADTILKDLKDKSYIDLTDYQLKNITQKHWSRTLEQPDIKTRLLKSGKTPLVEISENTLLCKNKSIDSYSAAIIADFLRYQLVAQKVSFSFETVMSHKSKIDFLAYVKEQGYTTYLYFISTEDPEINVNRVENRVEKGGHSVPKRKIKDRYYRGMDLLLDALKAANRAYLLDNSKEHNFVILEKKYDGMGYPKVKDMPKWFDLYVTEKLS